MDFEEIQEKVGEFVQNTLFRVQFLAKFWKNYTDLVEFAEIKMDPAVLVVLTLIGMVIAFIVGSLLDVTLSFLLAVLVADLGFGMPFFLSDRKIDEYEARLPDVLHHIGTTLKTGGTVEIALREAAKVNYGPITKGLKRMLREINEGKTFEDSFRDFALESRSPLMKKVAVVIIAAKKSGGALLDTLTAMAEDIRAVYRLQRERKSKTLMQFMFILVAGLLVAPFVFGIVNSVLGILMKIGTAETMGEGANLVKQFDLLFKIYLIVAGSLIVMCSTQIREGKLSKSIIYIPIGIIVSYVVYVFISSSFISMLGG
jgi:pilus assembly protein TadC